MARVGKFALAYAIAGGVMASLIFVVSTPERTAALWRHTIVAGIWLLWPLSAAFRKSGPVAS